MEVGKEKVEPNCDATDSCLSSCTKVDALANVSLLEKGLRDGGGEGDRLRASVFLDAEPLLMQHPVPAPFAALLVGLTLLTSSTGAFNLLRDNSGSASEPSSFA